MIRLPLVLRTRLDMALHNLAEMRKANHVLRRANDRLQGERDEARAQRADLMEKYHALRVNGADPVQPFAAPEVQTFGPLTRAALHDMGVGQSGPVKRAQQTKAWSIWLENRGHDNQDEVTAIAVRQGER